jgi:2-iminoacetate synthase ThiH
MVLRADQPGTLFSQLPGLCLEARELLPDHVSVQVPPNLVLAAQTRAEGLHILLACIQAGARDLGGISPLDEVNPDFAFPSMLSLQQELQALSSQSESLMYYYVTLQRAQRDLCRHTFQSSPSCP